MAGFGRRIARLIITFTAVACVFLAVIFAVQFSTNAAIPSRTRKGVMMQHHVSGTFEVKLNPQKPDNKEEESAKLGRMSIDKQFQGGLEAASKGEMLAFTTDVKGSAGYVAIERVTGTLDGRTGSFVLQHSGTMARGVPQMSVTVVPDSGTDQLIGLAGEMTIEIKDGKHFYNFDYSLTQSP